VSALWSRDVAELLRQMPGILDQQIAGIKALLSPPAEVGSGAKRPLRAESQNFVPPQTAMEHAIADVWQRLFGLKQISIEENFFDLGGHSLLLLQMHARLREALKTEIQIVTLLAHPSIRLLARHLEQPATGAIQTSQQWRDRALRQKQALAQVRKPLKNREL